jgi:Ca2+ transporting ATPase
MKVQDSDIVVGDIVSVNAHMAATVSCDGILLSDKGVKADESALTGEPEPISKCVEETFMISDSTINASSGKMLIVAIGEFATSGKFKKSVYDGEEEDETLLVQKVDNMVNLIAYFCMAAACWCLVAKMGTYFALAEETKFLIQAFENIFYAIGILAVAVPEGLPLALTITLAFCFSKLSTQNNLVKSLSSWEIMWTKSEAHLSKYIGPNIYNEHLGQMHLYAKEGLTKYEV